MQIANKTDMYAHLLAGDFGNTFRVWRSLDAAIAEGYIGPFGLRTSRRSGQSWYSDMTLEQARKWERTLSGLDLYWNEFVPNDQILLNGELMRTPHGLALKFAMGPQHMRSAMAQAKYATGMMARAILITYVEDSDVEWLYYLMDKYDGASEDYSACVEFTVFSCPVGTLQRETVIWEVRSY